jgi:class 3 adenylate cyclase/tetratricopeptide (TPR) repeat protein
MKCRRCQHENPSESNFCLGCGTGLGVQCAPCGNELPPGSRFCNKCGHAVSARSASERPFASPDAYTPKHLAEKILTSKAALEGERKQVTVLFADLKGSMELLADRDPEEARKLLDPVLARMMEAVHRYEGTVNQVMGDGIMALFGAPLAHEDHAVRACYAALDMQATIRRYAEEVRRSHGVVILVRVGLNSGEVVVRAIGSDLRMDYTAVGQTTHLAARMEQLAKPDTTLLTADVLRLAEGFIVVTPLGAVPVKGLSAPVEVYEMTGAGPLRSRLHAAASRGLTRFVGRETELEQLRNTLARAAGGHGQVVAIVGEPGVGKSRLIWEVTHSHRVYGWLVLQAGSVSYGKATSYLPVVDLLKGYFGIEDRDGPRAVREKLTGKLLTLDRAQESSLPALLSLLDVATEESQWAALDPLQRRQRTLDAVKRLLLRESQVQPLLLVFEDLHWIDSETQALLDGLVESVPAARLVLLVNYRPEYRHGWGSKTYYTQLRLDPLPVWTAQALLVTLLGADPSLGELPRRLIERTEGNPFFLEESVRSLAETKALVGERGDYRLTEPLHTIQVPATVRAILAARIDRLPPETKDLLQTAAIIGPDVPITLLQALVDRPEPVLREDLARLQAAEFLYESQIFPDLEYTFKHALTQEVAYGGLLQERRRALHARVVEALEQGFPGRAAEQVERLAYHAVRGEVWEKAVTYLRQAGAKALGRSANQAAGAAFEQALTASAHLPKTGLWLANTIDLHLDACTVLFHTGAPESHRSHLRDAEELAAQLGDRHRLGWVSFHLSRFMGMAGTPGEIISSAQRALAIGEELRDQALNTVATYQIGFGHHVAGDYQLGIRELRRVIEDLDASGRRQDRCGLAGFPAIFARSFLAWALAEIGEFDEGLAHGHEALRLAESMDHPLSMVVACRCVTRVLCVWGKPGDARPLAERALSMAQAWDQRTLLPTLRALLGHVATLSGERTEAVRLLEQAQTEFAAMGAWNRQSRGAEGRVYLAEAYLLAERFEEAEATTVAVLSLTRESGLRGYEAHARRLLAELAARAGPPVLETAHARYAEAFRLATELGMRPLLAHCHLGLGKLYRRMDKRQEAQKHLTTAAAMYREMNMGFWLGRAEAAVQEAG